MIESIFEHLIHVIGDKVCIKLLDRAKTVQNRSFINMTVSPTVYVPAKIFYKDSDKNNLFSINLTSSQAKIIVLKI